ncbi:probable glutathione S-transferase [Dioscorea cayenensis subsp. rotundata]|uniref:Glutathione S-transferase n=1 Tax=Dioscorea cayennensis subsp. rotundata TaxID=55577 RepID=A0AB40BQH6_DIOCR|nr:probable glutathione S-transferase [Dioscorea cayenensis subsp. rotundata]
MERSVKLHGHWASLFVHRVQLALHLKGVKYEFIEEDLDNKSSSLLLYNPVYKKVPVLVHGDCPVAESLVILRYVDDVWKDNPIMPVDDPYERAMVSFWCHFVDNKLFKSFGAAIRASGEEQAKAIEEFHQNLMFLEQKLAEKGSKFFGGEKIDMLDIVIGCGSHWFKAVEELSGLKLIDPILFPHFLEWKQNFIESQEVKEVIPPFEKLTDYAKSIYKKILGHDNN